MHVIFDTNPYRYLAFGKTPEQVKVIVSKLKAAETAHGISALAAPTVWLELFYHLAEPNGWNYEDCLSGVVACYMHTRLGDTNQYSLAPRAGMLQAHTLFDHKDDKEDDLLRTMDYIAAELFKNPTSGTIAKYAKEFKGYRQFVLDQEDAFMARFEKEKHKMLKDDPLREMYLGLAQMVANHLGMRPDAWSPSEREMFTNKVELYFPAPFQLYLEIRKRYIENPKLDIGTGSKRNWFRDHDMLFYINRRVDLTLVTDDRVMLLAAGKAGLADKAKRFVDYLGEIEVDLDQLRN